MKNLIYAAITSIVLLMGTTACAEEVQCPTLTGSELSRHGNYHWMVNTFDYNGERGGVFYTNMPWRMFQSDMFLSTFTGSAHMQIEANTGDTIVLSPIDGSPVVMIWKSDTTGFAKGFVGSFKTVDAISNDKALQGCFNKFINVKSEVE